MTHVRTGLATLEDGVDATIESGHEQLLVAAHNRVRITTLHDATPTIVCRGRAEVRLVSRDRSRPEVVVEDGVTLRMESLGVSAPRVHAGGSSYVFALARDTSAPVLEVVDAGLLKLIVQDKSAPRCHDWPAGWRARPSEIYVGQRLSILPAADDAERIARAYVAEWYSCRNRLSTAFRIGNAIPMLCADAVDVRWVGGTVHIELPTEPASRPWLSHDAHDPHPFTEARRTACTKVYL